MFHFSSTDVQSFRVLMLIPTDSHGLRCPRVAEPAGRGSPLFVGESPSSKGPRQSTFCVSLESHGHVATCCGSFWLVLSRFRCDCLDEDAAEEGRPLTWTYVGQGAAEKTPPGPFYLRHGPPPGRAQSLYWWVNLGLGSSALSLDGET